MSVFADDYGITKVDEPFCGFGTVDEKNIIVTLGAPRSFFIFFFEDLELETVETMVAPFQFIFSNFIACLYAELSLLNTLIIAVQYYGRSRLSSTKDAIK
jgi:hypothetical protein